MSQKTAIKDIHAREILDSRGDPTIEVRVTLNNGISAKASVPSGASTGQHEAIELRDGEKRRFEGKGVLKAVRHVNHQIQKALACKNVCAQQDIDQLLINLDGTPNKSRLGANAILGVSLACARAASLLKRLPLYQYLRSLFPHALKQYLMPVPTFNIFNGGKHADNNLDVQEIMVIPYTMKRFSDRVRAGFEIFHALGRVLREAGLSTNVGNEGGYAPSVHSCEEALDFILKAVSFAHYKAGEEILLGVDIGASAFYDAKKRLYMLRSPRQMLRNEEMLDWYEKLLRRYPLFSIEDPIAEDEWGYWRDMTLRFGQKVILIGDDLFVTQRERLQKGIDAGVANAILIKPNQIGTLSETFDTVLLAQQNGYKISVSHRSGETCDDFIADLAVSVNADFVKMGSSRGERVCKYNRLMEIEEEIR